MSRSRSFNSAVSRESFCAKEKRGQHQAHEMCELTHLFESRHPVVSLAKPNSRFQIGGSGSVLSRFQTLTKLYRRESGLFSSSDSAPSFQKVSSSFSGLCLSYKTLFFKESAWEEAK
jgi:hypothetical protein